MKIVQRIWKIWKVLTDSLSLRSKLKGKDLAISSFGNELLVVINCYLSHVWIVPIGPYVYRTNMMNEQMRVVV